MPTAEAARRLAVLGQATPPAPVLRGRDAELAAIGVQLDRVHSGAGAVVLVEGHPGMGKTRLLAEVARVARRLALRVGAGAAEPGGGVVEPGLPPARRDRSNGNHLARGSPAASSSSSCTTSSGSTSGGGSSSSAGTTTASRAATGDAVDTQYGSAQVRVTVNNGKIVKVQTLQLQGHDPRSVMISSAAEPILQQEVLAQQTADVDAVSGATFTSASYTQSLQSALDKLGFKAHDGSRATLQVPQGGDGGHGF